MRLQRVVRQALDPIDVWCIRAGAGTGKTERLIGEYLDMVRRSRREGRSWDEAVARVVAVTFTRRAAGEMADRVAGKLAQEGGEAVRALARARISTIDSLASQILRSAAFAAGLEARFDLLDEPLAKVVFHRMAVRLLDGDPSAGKTGLPLVEVPGGMEGFLDAAYTLIHRLRQEAVRPDGLRLSPQVAAGEGTPYLELVRRLYLGYEAALLEEGKQDFAGLLLAALTLLERGTELEVWRAGVGAVLVDEYQDTDPLRDRLLRLLVGPGARYVVVGDVKQSIYAFRGATPGLFLKAAAESERQGHSSLLSENFRSYHEILSRVNHACEPLLEGYEPIHSSRVAGSSRVEVVLAAGVDEEAERVARWIRELLDSGRLELPRQGGQAAAPTRGAGDQGRPLRPDDFAILLRSLRGNEVPYEEALRRQGVPFITSGGSGFYDRPEVRDALAILETVEDPFNDFALARALRTPMVRATNSMLAALASPERRPLADGLAQAGDLPLAEDDRRALLAARAYLDRFLQERRRLSLPALVARVLRESGLRLAAASLPAGERDRAVANLEKLEALAVEFDRHGLGRSLRDFLVYLREVEKQGAVIGEAPLAVGSGGAVNLLTIHQAKGLEFPVVAVVGVTPGQFPAGPQELIGMLDHEPGDGGGMLIRDLLDKKTLEAIKQPRREVQREEEARIFYVALTRARERLLVSGTKRSLRGGAPKVSEFLDGFLTPETG